MSRTGWRERARRMIEAAPGLERRGEALTEAEQRVLASVRNAVATTGRYSNAEDRMKVIDMVYWRKATSLRGAAICCRYSYDTVQEWNADFVGLVDAYYRYECMKT